MKRTSLALITVTLLALAGRVLTVQGQPQNQPTGSARFSGGTRPRVVDHIGNRLIAMARIFLKTSTILRYRKTMRTFAENLLHVAAVDFDLIHRVFRIEYWSRLWQGRAQPLA